VEVRKANLAWWLGERARLVKANEGKSEDEREYFVRALYAPHKGAFFQLPPKSSVGAGTGECAACAAAAEEEAFETYQPLFKGSSKPSTGSAGGGGQVQVEGFKFKGHEYCVKDFVFLDPNAVGKGAKGGSKETHKGRNIGLRAWPVAQIVGFEGWRPQGLQG